MQRALPRRTRWAGRSSIGELVAWDVGLLILATLLLVGERALSKGPSAPLELPVAQASPSPARTAAPQATRPMASPVASSPAPSPTDRLRRGPTRFVREQAPARTAPRGTALQELEGEVRRLLVEGDPDAALKQLDGADPALTARPEWGPLRERLQAAIRAGDAWVAERARLEAAADRGDVTEADAIVAALPGAVAREPLEAELALAKARARKSGDFEVTGFVPGEVRVEGSRALVSGPVDERQARTLLDAVEAVLDQAGRLGLSGLPAPLEVRLQAPDAPKVDPAARRIVTVVRAQDGLESLGTRLRWHTARWAAGQRELPAWLRLGLTRVLAGSLAGARPTPAPAARAWRRLFLTQPPLGDGVALQDLLAASAPDPIRAWALTWFAGYRQDPHLPPLQDLLAGRARLQLDAATAADLEAAWVAGLEGSW